MFFFFSSAAVALGESCICEAMLVSGLLPWLMAIAATSDYSVMLFFFKFSFGALPS